MIYLGWRETETSPLKAHAPYVIPRDGVSGTRRRSRTKSQRLADSNAVSGWSPPQARTEIITGIVFATVSQETREPEKFQMLLHHYYKTKAQVLHS